MAAVKADDVALANTEIRAPYAGRLGAFAYSVKAGEHVVVEGQLQLTNGMNAREQGQKPTAKAVSGRQTAENGSNP